MSFEVPAPSVHGLAQPRCDAQRINVQLDIQRVYRNPGECPGLTIATVKV
jgi:hypothetical protein